MRGFKHWKPIDAKLTIQKNELIILVDGNISGIVSRKKENANDLYLDIALLFRYKILSQFLVFQTILLSNNDECFDSMVSSREFWIS